ncbi:glycosyltransferase [Bacillus wiedmannii]|uniref:glycosyltransferase n=1 Tax=Bacillus wiedmannii TaxID=1890302 RepID=UPI000BEF3006|nr:glycosyltransferase [Bacillus wiedmannii]PEO38848.1 colanic acid biosynthesis glycosyltransferase WcaL [Bacillus wiedmannii]
MNILFFVSSFPALSETFILNQITGLIDAGHDVSILSWKQTKTSTHPDVEKYDLLSKVTYIDIPESKIRRNFKAIPIFWKCMWRNPKLAFEMIRFKKYGNILFSLRPLFAMEHFICESKWDAIVCHYGTNGLLASIFREQNIIEGKVLTFFHGNDLTGFTKKFGHDIYQFLFKTNTMLLPISERWKQTLIDLGANPKNIKVHHMGVNLHHFNYVPLANQTEVLKIVLVGRLTEKKGIDIAIQSVYGLKKKGYLVQLCIVGDGEEKQKIVALIAALRLQEEVQLFGWLTQEKVIRMIEQASLIILPSKTSKSGDMEGIPVSLMEAMARGKLVISTYHSGIPELIDNDKNGWLVAENDAGQLTKKIIEVIEHPEQWEQVSKNARKKVDESYNIDTLNRQLIDRIQE